jgi:hypothetical protein
MLLWFMKSTSAFSKYDQYKFGWNLPFFLGPFVKSMVDTQTPKRSFPKGDTCMENTITILACIPI